MFSFLSRIVEEMSILHGSVSCTLCCSLGNFPRVEVGIVIDAYCAVSHDNEEESANQEESAQGPSKEWCSISNKESSRNEDVEVTFSRSRLEEQEVVFHELEVTERCKEENTEHTTSDVSYKENQ